MKADLIESTKRCPSCAEEVKEAAAVCRFCAYRFPAIPVLKPANEPSPTSEDVAPSDQLVGPTNLPVRRGRFGKLIDFTGRHPKSSFASIFLVGLLIGSAAGAQTSQVSKLKSQISGERSQLSQTRTELASTRSDLSAASGKNSDLSTQVSTLQAKLTAATARRPMPSLIGKTQGDAKQIADHYGWDFAVHQQVSGKPVGTVLSQQPSVGTIMRAGAPLSVTVAQPAPPGWKDVKVWSGQGSMNTNAVNIPSGTKTRVIYSFTGNTNAIITLYRTPHRYVDLLLNEIGNRAGQTRLYYSGQIWFDIEGGSWTVRLQEWK